MATGNPRGRPPKTEPRITEADYPALYEKWLRGTSIWALAREYGVDWHAANHHLQKCRDLLSTKLLRSRNEVLDEINLLKAEAYQCLKKSQRPLTHDEVAREVDQVAIDKGISSDIASQVVKQTTRITMRDGDASWASVALACLDMENKLCGHYETGKREAAQARKGAYRAAGRSPKETHQAMAERLLDVLAQRRQGLTTGTN